VQHFLFPRPRRPSCALRRSDWAFSVLFRTSPPQQRPLFRPGPYRNSHCLDRFENPHWSRIFPPARLVSVPPGCPWVSFFPFFQFCSFLDLFTPRFCRSPLYSGVMSFCPPKLSHPEPGRAVFLDFPLSRAVVLRSFASKCPPPHL